MSDPFDPAEEQAVREFSERLMPSYDEYVAKLEQEIDDLVDNEDVTIPGYVSDLMSKGMEEMVTDSYIRGKYPWYLKMAAGE